MEHRKMPDLIHDKLAFLPETAIEEETEWLRETHPAAKRSSAWKQQLRRLAILMRIAGLSLSPLPEPAIVPERPRIEQRIQDPVGQGELEKRWTDTDRNHTDALLEFLGDAAAQAETEAEAEALVGAMVPLAAEITPRVNAALLRTAPNLLAGLATATRVLYPHPQTRPLLRTLPSILHHTATDLQKQIHWGKPITAQSAVHSLAHRTYDVLQDLQRIQKALRHAQAVQQRYLR